jgi:urate oxidase
MISNKISLSSTNNKQFYAQTNQLSTGKHFYKRVKTRFLQQSAEYLGSTLSHREIEALLNQKNYFRSCKHTGDLQMSNNKSNRMNAKTFASIKWALTAVSGLLTTALIIVLET